MSATRKIGLIANLNRVKAQWQIANGLIESTDVAAQHRAYITAFGNPRLARIAADNARIKAEARNADRKQQRGGRDG